MNYIKKAVELADTFMLAEDSAPWSEAYMQTTHSDGDESSLGFQFNYVPQNVLDALAAQLVRQVDATEFYVYVSEPDVARIYDIAAGNYLKQVGGPDRTMNTIKAIVDSGVLDND